MQRDTIDPLSLPIDDIPVEVIVMCALCPGRAELICQQTMHGLKGGKGSPVLDCALPQEAETVRDWEGEREKYRVRGDSRSGPPFLLFIKTQRQVKEKKSTSDVRQRRQLETRWHLNKSKSSPDARLLLAHSKSHFFFGVCQRFLNTASEL